MSEQPPKPIRWQFILALAVTCVIVIVLLFCIKTAPHTLETKPCPSLSGSQIQSLAGGLKKFSAEQGNRPASLEELVKSGHVETKTLFSKNRLNILEIDKDSPRSEKCPDVVYFPALRESDPGELVLACTLLLANENDKYRVVYNNYRCDELDNREMVEALNRTYMYIGSKIDWDKVLPPEPQETQTTSCGFPVPACVASSPGRLPRKSRPLARRNKSRGDMEPPAGFCSC